jgi:hypothetical protein
MWYRQHDIEVHPPKQAILDLTASCINWRFRFQHIDRWENNVGLKRLDQWQYVRLAFRSHPIQFSMQTSCYDSHFFACSFRVLHSQAHSRLSSDCKHFHKSFLSVYSSRVLVDLGRFLSVLICTQSVGLLGRGISSSEDRYLRTEQHKHRINAHRHSCLEWDSKPRSRCSSGRRQFMP